METLIDTDIRLKTSLHFKRPELHDLPGIMRYLREFPSRSCDFSAGGIMIWRDFFDYRFCIHNDTLFLRGSDDNGVFFHRPVGARPFAESLSLIREYCAAEGFPLRVIMPRETSPDELDTFNSTHATALPDWMEYVYTIEQFEHFAGRKMEKKRNHLNYFLHNFEGYEVTILDGSETDELVEFTDRFNLYHSDEPTFEYESNATADALREYTEYPYFGLLIRYKGEILGYTFGEAIGDTFFIHAEKGNIEYRGIYQILSSELAQKIREHYPDVAYLNREDDMGNDYLRQSKMSYHPLEFVAKYELRE